MVQTLNRWIHRTDMKLGTTFGNSGSNAAADRGIKYHRKVFKALEKRPDLYPGFELLVEPWYREKGTGRHCQPDTVLLDRTDGLAIVIEVKLNWKGGRDEKLLDLYLPATKSVFGIDHVWPLLITQDLRGYRFPPLLGLTAIMDAMSWEVGRPTPLMLHP